MEVHCETAPAGQAVLQSPLIQTSVELAVPITSNLVVGFDVPMPTSPLVLIRTLSESPTKKARGGAEASPVLMV